MKKIVALVLSLVMALSLCTVAFAANYSDAYEWTNGGWKKYDLNGVAISYTSAKDTVEDGKVVGGTLAYYTIGEKEGYFVKVSDDTDATFQMKVDGKVVYLAQVTVIDYDKVGTSVKAGTKCGDYDKDVYGDSDLIKVGDDLYVVTDNAEDVAVLVGDEVVYAAKDENPDTVPHEWYTIEGKVVTDAGKLAEVKGTVLCKNCKVKATVTDTKKGIPTNATVYYDADLGVYMYWVDSANGGKTDTTTNTGVNSPKTFDAGIVMYVGMSLLSVAGGAVVIGKKKEF